MKQKLSNFPVKGTSDWFPEEYAIRRYIFETWRRVNRQFGYEEYLPPLLEAADIYRAKSGEDVGNKELIILTDPAGRELALRPEMTPSVTRMVTRFYKQTTKPLRLFSIANFWRNEKPQRGRNREFWQLNTDIFGSNSMNADLEILQLSLEIMLAFQPPKSSFTLYMNHRFLIDTLLTELAKIPKDLCLPTIRLLDKYQKLGIETFRDALQELGLEQSALDQLSRFIQSQNAEQLLENFPELENDPGYQQILYLLTTLQDLGYGEWVVFNPSIIRGFNYYDGVVFEIFDNHPSNRRAMFGGGRYNGLARIFGEQDIPAVGIAPGDETTRLFLQSWKLIPEHLQENRTIYVPLLDEKLIRTIRKLVQELRQAAFIVEQGLEFQSVKQALSYANKRNFPYVLLLGPDELNQGTVSLKNMRTGEQAIFSQTTLVQKLKKLAEENI
jgi:histidyl-tRNA synthetase